MDEVLDPAQAIDLVDKLHAYRRRLRQQRQAAWKKHATKFPDLRIWLANVARFGRETAQNVLSIAHATREYGVLIATKSGVSVSAQIAQQLRLFHKYRVPADSYYLLGMYKEPIRKKARFFLGDGFTSTILHHLASDAPNGEAKPLHEKVTFWKHCRKHGLPTVPVLGVFKNGCLQKDFGGIRNSMPSQNLFSKPVTAFLGRGAQKWTYENEGHFRDADGHLYDSDALFDALKKQSHDKPLLLQPCVYDHPDLQAFTGGSGPSTLRIVTIRKPGEPPEYLAGFLTSPKENVSAPTFKNRTAFATPVTESGKLGRLLHKSVEFLPNGKARHPVTGQQVAGSELPHWDQAKALALQAHATLSGIACVGWDLILTPNGPRLLEGNNDCSAALTQITHKRLLGLTRFPAYLNAYLQEP